MDASSDTPWFYDSQRCLHRAYRFLFAMARGHEVLDLPGSRGTKCIHFSWMLFLLAGYGYRLRWCLLWPVGLVAVFALCYWALDPVHLPWWIALGESVNVFHGRGAAPNVV